MAMYAAGFFSISIDKDDQGFYAGPTTDIEYLLVYPGHVPEGMEARVVQLNDNGSHRILYKYNHMIKEWIPFTGRSDRLLDLTMVVLESPFAGDTDRNMEYLSACMCDCLRRGEAPIASHRLYPGLVDGIGMGRRIGIEAGFIWGMHAKYTVAYVDFGISGGMRHAIDFYTRCGMKVYYRTLNHFNEEVLLVGDCKKCGMPIDSMNTGKPTLYYVCPNCGEELPNPVQVGTPMEGLDDAPPKEYRKLVESE